MLEPNDLEAGREHMGVVYYAPAYAKVTYKFTKRAENCLVTDSCDKVVDREEIVLVPDLDRPLLIRNASDALSGAKFAVALDRGMLVAVGAEPSEKGPEWLGAAAQMLTAVRPSVASLVPKPKDCNADSRLLEFARLRLMDPQTD